jgi:ankyrin repeat protein
MSVLGVLKKKSTTNTNGKQSIVVLARGMACSEEDCNMDFSMLDKRSPLEIQFPQQQQDEDIPWNSSTHLLIKSKQLAQNFIKKDNRPFSPTVSSPQSSDPELSKLLHRRIARNDFNGFKLLLENSERGTERTINYRNPLANNCTLLHTAAQYNRPEFMIYLLDGGHSSVEDVDDFGATPLFYACAHPSNNALKILLERGARVNIQDHFGNTPLLTVMKHSRLAEAELLLNNGADIHMKSFQGDTALHYCASIGSVTRLRWLLDHNASLFRTNAQRETPLFNATCSSATFTTCIEYLSNNRSELVRALQQKNESGKTVIHKIAELSKGLQSAMLLCIVVNGVCKAFATSVPGGTEVPLARKRSTSMINRILKTLPKDQQPENLDKERDTVLRQLLNSQDSRGDTPLHRALLCCNDFFVQFLISCTEVDMGIQNKDGDTPIHVAVRKDRREIAELLLQSASKEELRKTNRQSISATQMCKSKDYNLKDGPKRESIFLLPSEEEPTVERRRRSYRLSMRFQKHT